MPEYTNTIFANLKEDEIDDLSNIADDIRERFQNPAIIKRK